MNDALDRDGFALLRNFVDSTTAVELRSMYAQDERFRSRVVMERHAFGKGEYKYFANPLPPAIAALREKLYAMLLPAANEWAARLGGKPFPSTHQEFLSVCFASEQKRPTALMLRYRAGDYNALHQDLYGPVAFPLQATIYLSRLHEEYEGGEVVLVEQKPRAQSRAHVLSPDQGDLLILPTRYAPRRGSKGDYRVTFRHGVSALHSGERYALGIIFHDAL